MYTLTPKLLARFESKFTKGPPSRCWLWKGYLHQNGYGLFTIYQKRFFAHKVAWTLAHHASTRPSEDIQLDKLPPGVVGHSCSNRICVNPSHLTWGLYTQRKASK